MKAPKAEEVDEIVRVSFPLPKKLHDRVEAYWHSKKLRSLSAAIRELLERGLGR